MTDCPHDWTPIGLVTHARIADNDPTAHTSFYLLGCTMCRTVVAFPAENAALVTPTCYEQLRRELDADDWQLPDIRWTARTEH